MAGAGALAATAALGLGLAYMMAYERWTFFADLWGDFLVVALIFSVLAFEYGLYRLATNHRMPKLHVPIVAAAAACLLLLPRWVKVVNGPDLRWEQLRSAITTPRDRPTSFPAPGR